MIFWIIQNIFQTISNQKTEAIQISFLRQKMQKLKILLLSILERGIVIFKGHESTGGFRINSYNLFSLDEARALIEFADSFHK